MGQRSIQPGPRSGHTTTAGMALPIAQKRNCQTWGPLPDSLMPPLTPGTCDPCSLRFAFASQPPPAAFPARNSCGSAMPQSAGCATLRATRSTATVCTEPPPPSSGGLLHFGALSHRSPSPPECFFKVGSGSLLIALGRGRSKWGAQCPPPRHMPMNQ